MMTAAIQNTKKKETQVSIIKEKHSRYTTPANHGWKEKEEGNNDENSHSKYKIKERHNFQSSKKSIQGTHHPLIRVGRKKNSGLMMKAAI